MQLSGLILEPEKRCPYESLKVAFGWAKFRTRLLVIVPHGGRDKINASPVLRDARYRRTNS